jgi:hypothetical protein
MFSVVPTSCLLFNVLCMCRLCVIVLDVSDVFVVMSL